MGRPLHVPPADLGPNENPLKVGCAIERFVLNELDDLPAFHEAYTVLERQFGPVGEIERRDVLEGWFRGSLSPQGDPVRAFYHLVEARDQGELAGLRDCFCAVDPERRRVVVLLSHSLVLPDWRRTGLAALLRAVPVGLAREDARRCGVETPEILLVAEMEPVEPSINDSVVRLVAYGRGGFQIVPPWEMPYAQPDFRDLDALNEPAIPLPLMWVVRHVGQEGKPTLSSERALGILEGLRAIHAPAVGEAQLAMIRAHALSRGSWDKPFELPLISPPNGRASLSALRPVLRGAWFDWYPESWFLKPRTQLEREVQELETWWKEGS